MSATIETLEMVVKEEAAPVLVVQGPAGMDPADVARTLGIPVMGELSSATSPEDFAYFARAAGVIQESRPRELVYRRRNGRE